MSRFLMPRGPEVRFIACVKANPKLTAIEYAELLDLTQQTVNYHIRKCAAYHLGHPHRIRPCAWTRYADCGKFMPRWEVEPFKRVVNKPSAKSRAQLAKTYRAKRKATIGMTNYGAGYKLAQGGKGGIWGPLMQLSRPSAV